MSKVIEITNVSEYDAFKNNHRRGIILYGAEWCEACKQINPLYTRIANRYYKRIAMAHVDVDVCKLEFSKVPVFVSFRKGTQFNSMEGADSDALKEFIREAIEHDSKQKTTTPQRLEGTHRFPSEQKPEVTHHKSRVERKDVKVKTGKQKTNHGARHKHKSTVEDISSVEDIFPVEDISPLEETHNKDFMVSRHMMAIQEVHGKDVEIPYYKAKGRAEYNKGNTVIKKIIN